MSEALQNCLIVVAANLAGMLIIYSLMAFMLARLGWHGRGMGLVFATLALAQLFWLVPAILILGPNSADALAAWTIWFGNWLVSGFGIVLLWQAGQKIPRQMEDSARLDGCGVFGTFRHVILPLVRREVGLLAVLTVMATLLPFWALVTTPNAGDSFIVFQRVSSSATRIGMMLAGSLLGMLPVIAIFFFARRPGPFPLRAS
jgi:ABC-type glycerol-3-phosphate transport system permease component